MTQSYDIGVTSYHMGKLLILVDSYKRLRVSMNMQKGDLLERIKIIDSDTRSLERALERYMEKGDVFGSIALVKKFSGLYMPKSEDRLKIIERKVLEHMRTHKSPSRELEEYFELNPENWYGYNNLSDAVHLYIYENPKDRFSVKELSKYFGTNAAPVYQILRAHPFLKEMKGESEKVFIWI